MILKLTPIDHVLDENFNIISRECADGRVIINWDNVRYVRKMGHTRIIFTDKDFLDVSESMEEIEKILIEATKY